MDLSRLKVVFATVALLISLPVAAQTGSATQEEISPRQLRQLRTEAEKNPFIEDDLRIQILALYEEALGLLEQAANNRRAAKEIEAERTGIDPMVSDLRAELEKPETQPRLPLRANATVEEAEDALARERARLAANRTALRNQERIAEDRAQSRNDISRRLGELDLELELLNDELRRQAESLARTELKAAIRSNILARREAGFSEIDLLRARLTLLSDRSALTPLETDLAQRRVSFNQELVSMLEDAAHDLRAERAREELKSIREQSQRLSEKVPSLAPIAAETEELANTLWGADGVVSCGEQTEKALSKTRDHQAQLNRIAELTSRKFEAYGRRGSLTRWWPDFPSDFPEAGTIARTLQRLDEEIPEVEHGLITYEQLRSRALDLSRHTMLDLQTEYGEDLDPEMVQSVRDLLAVRQDLLDELIRRGGQYSDKLTEYRTASAKFRDQLEEVERFLFSHILWSRSVPRPIIPRPRPIGEAMGWLTSTSHWKEVSIVGMEFRGIGLAAAVLVVLLLLLRQPLRRRLHEIGKRVADPERDGLKLTVEALVITGLLAASLPLTFFAAAEFVQRAGGSPYWFASARTLFELAVVAALFETVRQVFAPDGLAEAHFSWPAKATRPLHRGLKLTEAIGLPLLYVALQLAFAGMRINSPENLQLYNNSLGRVAFIAALVLFGLSILAMLRPAEKTEPSNQEMRVPWPPRFAKYAFPTAFLGAYPLIILATFVPAILATFGFYITGMLLAYQMLRTLLLAFAVMVGGGLVHRWRVVNRNRTILDAPDGEKGDVRRLEEFEAAEKQVKQLFRFGVIAVLAVGLFSIWSDALPMLQLLKRVQILPRVQMLEPIEGSATTPGAADRTPAPVAQAESETGAADETDAGPITGVPTKIATAQTAEVQPLTLWNLLEAILAGLVTLVLVKNLPGFIEIMLQRRTTLDGGARFAFSTLVRYSITIIGTTLVFGLLGVTWDKVQWLAAALTFGLGFGLQEIVANFVSGLILLIERPVRVGDVVTIGSLMGKVTRIQIRATTITLWDRSEMIVPNKEFITTKLVNWTLSDSKRRIEIPLRVAYGTDLELVKKILVEAAEQHPAVLDEPAPQVLLLTFGNDAVNLELRFVVDFGQGLVTKDQVQMAIDRAFREQGIEFALPKSEVRFISKPGDAPGAVDPVTG